MNKSAGWAVLSLILVFGGCAEKKSEASTSQANPAAQEQPSQHEPAPQATPPVQPSLEQSPALAEPARSEAVAQLGNPEPSPAATSPTATAKSAETTPAAPPEPAPTESKKAVAKDVLVLTGSPLGGVRFEHKLHVARAGNNCATCHHASRPEKPASAPQQACSDCHMSVAAPPMKTKRQAAFHNPTAQSGTCIDCHKAEGAKAKKPPLNCMECHKKENK